MFYNQSKTETVYRYLITPSTLLSFIPPNCQFDDYGNPMVSIQELQLNVGIWLVKHFNESTQSLEKSFLSENSIIYHQNSVNMLCKKLIEYHPRSDILKRRSLASNYQRELDFDEKEYNFCLYQITQKVDIPIAATAVKVCGLDEFKQN